MAIRVDFTGSNARTRGDTWSFAAEFSGGLESPSAIVSISLRRYTNSADPGYVTLRGYPGYTAEGVTIVDGTHATFEIDKAFTADIPAGRVPYEIKVQNHASPAYKVTTHEGWIEVREWSGQEGTIESETSSSLAMSIGVAGVPSYTQISLASILTALGARVHFWFEVGVSSPTIDGSDNFSALEDLGPGGYDVSQADAGARPAYTLAGGPNGKPCMTFQSAQRRLFTSAINLVSGSALTFFTVAKAGATGTTGQALCRVIDTESAGDVCEAVSTSETTLRSTVRTATSAEETAVILTPAINTNWRLRVTRFAPDLAVQHKVDDIAVSPPFGATVIGPAAAVQNIMLGSHAAAGGALYLRACIEDLTGAEEAQIRMYIAGQTLL